MIVGIAGAMGAGKDTVASWLVREQGFVRVGFADALKQEVREKFRRTLLRTAAYVGPYVDATMGPDLERHLMPEPDDEARLNWLLREKPPIVRELLQEFGTEVRRAEALDYWLARWVERALGHPRVVVPDVRFPNEAAFLTARGARLIRVDRPGRDGAGHASETSLAKWSRWDAVLPNVGTVADLEAAVAWWWAHP